MSPGSARARGSHNGARSRQPGRAGCRGHSLAEVLVAGGLFALILGTALVILVQGWRAFARGNNQVDGVRQARNCLSLASHELRCLEQVYAPEEGTLEGGTASLVYAITDYSQGGPQKQVRGLGWDSRTGVVSQRFFDPGYQPRLPASQKLIRSRELGCNITDFRLWADSDTHRLFSVSITAQPASKPAYTLTTCVLRRR